MQVEPTVRSRSRSRESRSHDANKQAIPQQLQNSPPLSALLGLDFDCTITVRHFYKCMVLGIFMRKPQAHAHCPAMFEWLQQNGITDIRVPTAPDQHPMVCATEFLAEKLGPEKFTRLVREVFLGGEERIQWLTGWLRAKKQLGVDLAIITAGISSTVSMALDAVPEWNLLFTTDAVLDVGSCRHQVSSLIGQKVLMLRDLRPAAQKLILVDDSLAEDPPPDWILRRARVQTLGLPYEGSGIDSSRCVAIDAALGQSREK